MTLRISIITVSYNSESTIRATLESVLSQKGVDLEYLVIDGGSRDGTVDIIRSYAARLSYWISEPDKGIYDAMNKGIFRSNGDIVGILNSDDVYASTDVLQEVVRNFETRSIDGLFARVAFFHSAYPDRMVRIWQGSPYREGCFQKGWHPAHPTFFVRRSVYERYGGFDLSFAVSADFELMLRLIEKHRIETYYLDRILILMRLGGESTGSLKKIWIGNRNVLRAFRKHGIAVSCLYPLRRFLPKIKNIIQLKLYHS